MKQLRSVPFFTLLPIVLAVREGDGGDAAAAAAAAAATAAAAAAGGKTFTQADIDAAVAGLKSKNAELLGSLHTTKEKLGAYGGLDPARAKLLQEQMDNDEDLKLIGEGKKNAVIEKYTERMRAQHTAQLEAERAARASEKQRADTYQGAVLDNAIRAVCGDCHKGAVDDALLLARQIFTLDAKGNAVKLDAEGRPELGKDGKNPFSPAEWMELQRELKPHWFPATTSGSGSGNSNAARGAGGKTMKRSVFAALTPTQQHAVSVGGTTIVD
jgi:hypothetical protein